MTLMTIVGLTIMVALKVYVMMIDLREAEAEARKRFYSPYFRFANEHKK